MNRKVKTPLPEAPPAELDSQAMLDLASHTDSDAGAAAEALVKKARRGDEAAFGALVETYERFVYHTALRVLRMYGGRAEDGAEIFCALIIAFIRFPSLARTGRRAHLRTP